MLVSFAGYSQADEYVREGNNYYEAKEFEKAEASYSKALLEDKDNLKGAFNKGDAYFRAEKYEEAAQVVNQRIVADGNKVADEAKAKKLVLIARGLNDDASPSIGSVKKTVRKKAKKVTGTVTSRKVTKKVAKAK